jgi:peptide/nickel transport system ATP-binding protein
VTADPVVSVSGLRAELAGGVPIIEEVGLEVLSGGILGLVGESGSGKSTTALALLGYTRPGVRIRGSVRIRGEELVGRRERDLRRIRGVLVSYVPQDPSSSLNPAIRIGDQVAEILRVHSRPATEIAVREALGRVLLPTDREFARRFPHQLSGGQQQRVAIATALVCDPALVVMDEPTTGLDVVTQATVLEEIKRLRRELGLTIVYVSHNLAVVSMLADEVAVMYAGRIVEIGQTADVLAQPRHPYTRGLVAAVPDFRAPRRLRGIPGASVGVGSRPAGCAFAPRCGQAIARCTASMPELDEVQPRRFVRCWEWASTPALAVVEPERPATAGGHATPLLDVSGLTAVYGTRDGVHVAVRDLSFSVGVGEVVALVGESGSGKTTAGRCIVGLHAPQAGRIALAGERLAAYAGDRPREARRLIQIIFQNPYDSLNPRRTLLDEIARPARVLRGQSRAGAEATAASLIERVQLPAKIAQRYPSELSGGERQRVAIARALAAEPALLICDEITSSLDVSVQATVIELIHELQVSLGLALVFISHDLGVVATVASRVLVLESGIVREQGILTDVLGAPTDGYTGRLVEAAPRISLGRGACDDLSRAP